MNVTSAIRDHSAAPEVAADDRLAAHSKNGHARTRSQRLQGSAVPLQGGANDGFHEAIGAEQNRGRQWGWS